MINKLTFVDGTFDISFLCKFIMIFFMSCLLWHRYVVHDQYLAWRLGIFDAIIPMIFACIQVILIFSIAKIIIYFSFISTIFYFWGAIAYINATVRHDTPETEYLYREHFDCIGPDFAKELLWEIKNFEKKAIVMMIFFAAFSGLFTLIMHYKPYFPPYNKKIDDISTVVYTVFSVGSIFFLFRRDLRYELNKAATLKKYKFQW